MKFHLVVIWLLLTNPILQTIRGYVHLSDSSAVSGARIIVWGLGEEVTDNAGYFEFQVSEERSREIELLPGADLKFDVKMNGYAVLEPFDRSLRLPQSANSDAPFYIMVERTGSPLFLHNDRLLRQVIEDEIRSRTEALARKPGSRDAIEETARRLGLTVGALREAVDRYNKELLGSTDRQSRALALLYASLKSDGLEIREATLDSALIEFRAAISICENTIKKSDSARNELPILYQQLGGAFLSATEYDSALVYYLKADSCEPDDPLVLQSIADVYAVKRLPSLAIPYVNRAYAIDTLMYGPMWPGNIGHLEGIAWSMLEFNMLDGAIQAAQEAAQLAQFYYEVDSSLIVSPMATLALAAKKKGDWYRVQSMEDSATSYYRKAYDTYICAESLATHLYGSNDWRVATICNNMGNLAVSGGRPRIGLNYFYRALRIDSALFGMNSPKVSNRFGNIAYGLIHLGDSLRDQAKEVDSARDCYQSAKDYLHRALSILQVTNSPLSLSFGTCYENLSYAHERLEEFCDAAKFADLALQVYSIHYASDFSKTKECRDHLERLRTKCE